VVAPACGGPLDQVRPGENGVLYAPGDDAALRAAVTGLARDAGTRERMGLAARDGVTGRTWEALGDQLIGHYRKVIAAPAERARTTRRERLRDRTGRDRAA
jgi:phosphatidylinositol alpha 1,6-mannosyltransferase